MYILLVLLHIDHIFIIILHIDHIFIISYISVSVDDVITPPLILCMDSIQQQETRCFPFPAAPPTNYPRQHIKGGSRLFLRSPPVGLRPAGTFSSEQPADPEDLQRAAEEPPVRTPSLVEIKKCRYFPSLEVRWRDEKHNRLYRRNVAIATAGQLASKCSYWWREVLSRTVIS